MAKRFAGFKPETFEKKILPALGYDGPTDMKSINLFLAASPAAAAKMGRYTMAARRMVEGEPVKAAGGKYTTKGKTPTGKGGGWSREDLGIKKGPPPKRDDDKKSRSSSKKKSKSTTPAAQPATSPATDYPTNMPLDPPTNGATDGTLVDTTIKESDASKMTKDITEDPTKAVTKAAVVSGTGIGTKIAADAGQAGAAEQAKLTQAAKPVEIGAPEDVQAQIVDTVTAAGDVQQVLRQVDPATGEVSEEALVQAAQMDPTQAAALGLQAAQTQAAQVAPTAELEVTPEQLISGPTVDQARVEEALEKEQAASVRDELSSLMGDFEGGKTPAWAAGAMRAATAQMAARGLGASSMAGMATVQAAMESALPIAQMDASNKQQMALAKAEQRAAFLGQEFDQAFQTKVRNAARISEVANMNFTATQQVALENARMANTVNIANLDARNAKVLADAATMSQLDMANLNNRQQAQVQNAQAFLEMDMANLSNEQQTSLFKAQELTNAILSDTAAENAGRQFNATSQMQTDQFMANLGQLASQFNAEQVNSMAKFNAGEANAMNQFNTTQENLRDQFNASNHLVVAQANANWAQSVTTAANAATNQANRDAALAANNLTLTAYNNVVQRERDILAWAWQTADNSAERDANITIANISATGKSDGSKMLSDAGSKFLATIAANAANKIFTKWF
jgi:hypothetical protein